MGFWRWAGEIVGYVGAPFSGGATLVFAKSARNAVGDVVNQVMGRKVGEDGATNTISNKQNATNELTSDKIFEDTLKRIEAIEKKTGISEKDNIDKINEIKKSREEEMKDFVERINKNNSPEENKQIMDAIVNKTKEDLAAINKILGEDITKLNKRNLDTLEQASQAQQDGNSTLAASLFAESEKQQQNIKQKQDVIDLLNKKLSEKAKADKEAVQKLAQNKDKPWYQDLNFSSWQLWLAIIIVIFLAYMLYCGVMWVKRKMFSDN